MKVVFFTVIPSPYQRQLFSALAAEPDLAVEVYYYAATLSERLWNKQDLAPHERILPGITLSLLGHSAHLNPTVLNVIRHSDADVYVVSDYSAPTAQMAMRLLKALRRPWVFWGESPGFTPRGAVGSAIRKLLQRPLAASSAIAGIGTRATFEYQRLFPGIQHFNIPYFCDLAPYRQAAERNSKQRREYVNLLFSGQLIERKGVDVMLQAFTSIASAAPQLRLTILGDGPERTRYQDAVSQSLRSRVRFLGHHQPDALPELFADADAFCLPSRYDGWGVVVNEALGAGLPIVVSSAVGAGADLVDEGTNGCIFESEDVEALARALLQLTLDEDLRGRWSEGAKQASWKWGLDEGVKRWRTAFDVVIKR